MNAATDSMPEWLRQRAQSTPDRLALIAGDRRLTFRDLDAAVETQALRLRDVGATAGAVVALLAWNSAAYAVSVHAVARIGAVLLPLNARLTPDEIAWQLRDAEAVLAVHDEANAGVAAQLQAAVPGLTLLDLDNLAAVGGAVATPQPAERRFDLAALRTIVYTSGTTGRPKGARLTYGNHFWSAVGSALNLGLLPDDRWLACLPLFHVGGLSILHRGVIYGMTCLIHESFDPRRVNQAIDEDRVTIVSVVAAMLQQMLDARGDVAYPDWLRCVLLGGGPAPRPLLDRCAALGVPVVQTYGLTETASQITTLAPEEALTRLGSAGKPLFGSEVRIRRDDGSAGEPGEAGEIVVSGPTIVAGYLNRPEETAAALRDGWLHTGDIGYLDAEGYLYVLDRRDDLIVSGGENVYPAEVEAALQAHPDVVEAGVVGVADERWGSAPLAVVVLRQGARVDAESLRQFLRQRLASYKVPSRIVFTAALPRTASGKLLRSALRQPWEVRSSLSG